MVRLNEWGGWKRIAYWKCQEGDFYRRPIDKCVPDLASIRTMPMGPGVYDLELRAPRSLGRRIRAYHGRAVSLQSRLKQHARKGGHLFALVEWHAGLGWMIYARCKRTSNVRAAAVTERIKLGRRTPCWNDRLSRNRVKGVCKLTAHFPHWWRRNDPQAIKASLARKKQRLRANIKEDRGLKGLAHIDLRFFFRGRSV